MSENKIIYFDNNATTMVDPIVVEEMMPYFSNFYGNPSSMHDFGGKVGYPIQKAREQVASFVGASKPSEIVFTGSGTESANIAIRGVLEANPEKKHIVTTKIEHPCVLNVVKWAEKQGYKITYIDTDKQGNISIESAVSTVTDQTAIVCCMWANNETGVILPLEKLATAVKEKSAKTAVFVDAVQAAGKLPIDVKSTDIDLLAISGHKIHAPMGVGALYVRQGTKLKPFIIGGHQEKGRRAGTENVTHIVGLGKACELAQQHLDEEYNIIKPLRDKLEKGILDNVFNARVNGNIESRVPNTTNIAFEYIEGELILLHFSDIGICASSGSACTSGSLDPSHVLKAMGTPYTAIHGSVRFSLSRFTSEEEVDFAIKEIPPIIEKLSAISPFQKQINELRDLKLAVNK